jgi:small subunit ribosomal protein S8
MNTDPIADMLTRIRNACSSRKRRVDIPWSQVKMGVVKILKEEGFLEDYREIAGKSQGQGLIEVKLRYDAHNEPVIEGIQRLSRPGMRQYFGVDAIPKIRGGQGVVILTTSKGLMTDRQARNEGVGGEALCSVW